MGLGFFYRVLETEIRGANGTQFNFLGLRYNAHALKGYEGTDICWVEEAEFISEESWDYLIPTIRKPGSEIWVNFNPDQDTDPTAVRFIKKPQPDQVTATVTYKDNPWFPETLKREMEHCRATDDDKYRHIWLGEFRVQSERLVFAGKYVVEAFEIPEDADFLHGLDFGFAKDPAAAIRCYPRDGILYIDREAYGVGIELDALPDFLDTIPTARKALWMADSARPDIIDKLRKAGFSIKGAAKGSGSVAAGVDQIRSFKKVVIHPRCKNTADEFRHYAYKVHRLTRQILPELEDKNNHCIDGLRYGLEPLRKGGGEIHLPEVSAAQMGL